MQLTVDTALVDAAQALGPVIREHADQAERERRLPRPVMDALREAGLLRLYVPKSLGGLETDPLTQARVVEVLAGFDSVAGWALMAVGAVSWFCARLPDAGAEEIYADTPDVYMATPFHPPLQATATDDGYRISGRAPLASNCHEARWFFVIAVVMEGEQPKLVDGAPQVIGAIVRADQCELIDTWHSLGMRGSDSNDLAVNDALVPTRRTFPLAPDFRPGRHYGGPLYRAPVMAADVVVWTPVALAMARAAIDEVCALGGRKTPFASTTPLRERAGAQGKLGLAEATLQSARLLAYDTLAESWGRTQAGQGDSLEQKGELLMASVHAMQSAAKVVELMHGVAGTSGIYARNRLERLFRDMETLKQHGFYSESRYETVGQVLLGLPPDLALVVF